MKFKNIIISFVVMCLLVGALILVKKKEEDRSKAKEASVKIFTIEPDEIDGIRLKNPKGDFLFKKEADEWSMLEPIATEPDPAFVPDLLSKLEKLESKRDFEVKNEELSDFGFDEPEFTLDITYGKNKAQKIYFGIKAPGENTQYTKIDDSLKVRLADTSLSDLRDKTLFDLRNKDIIKFSKEQVEKILVSYPATKEQYTIEKKGNGYSISEPIAASADKNEIDRFIGSLTGIKANEYPAEDYLRSPEKWGFAKPFASISVVLKDGSSKQLLIGKESKEPKGVYVTDPKSKLVAITDESLKKNLTVDLSGLIDKKLANWPEGAEIGKMEFALKGQPTVMEKKNDLWTIPILKDFADQNTASGLLSRTKYIRAQEFLTAKPLPEHGFDSPPLVVKVYSKEGKELGKISFGKTLSGNKVLVRGGPDDFIFKADDSFLNNTRTDLQKIRNKKPSLAKRYKISKVKLSIESGVATFSKNGPDWSVSTEGGLKYSPGKDKLEADSKKLLDFLTQDRITGFIDTYDPKLSAQAMGFDKPLANISVWEDTSSEEKIAIGKKEPDFAYLKREGSLPVYKVGIKDAEEILGLFKNGKEEGDK